MLDSKDLEILQTMMTQIVAASESRMSAKIEESIAASESRMSAKIEESIAASESKIMAYIESDILPRFDKLADGHDLLREALAPISRVERLEEDVSTLRSAVRLLSADVSELRKAQ